MTRRSKSRWLIKLAAAHRKSGLTIYAVKEALNMNFNTVKKYVSEDIQVEMLPPEVDRLVQFYGVKWDDVVTVIQDESDEDPEMKTLLAVPA